MDKQREAFDQWLMQYHKDHFGEEATVEDYSWDVWKAAQQAQWLPIETAPRDGTNVIAYRNGNHGINIDAMYFAYGSWRWSFDGVPPYHQPTYWMPLPPEPKP